MRRPVRVRAGGDASGDQGSAEGDDIGRHVPGVGQQRQGPGRQPGDELDDEEPGHQDERGLQPPPVRGPCVTSVGVPSAHVDTNAASGGGAFVADVLAGQVQHHPHVRVREPVIHQPPLPAPGHDPGGAQHPQRLRHRGLLGVGGSGQVAHAQLARLQQRVQQPRAGRVAQQLEHPRRADQLSLRQGGVTDQLDLLRVHTRDRARVQPGNLVI